MKTSELLRAAKPLLGKWCRGHFGVNDFGEPTTYDSAGCAGRCLRGALYAAEEKVNAYPWLREAERFLDRAALNRGSQAPEASCHYVTFNDTMCVDAADAARLYDEAIQLAEAEGD
jgi:hypothetical protein